MEENKPEVITILGAILKANEGDPTDLEAIIKAVTTERDNFVTTANQRIAGLNSNIELLSTLLEQIMTRNRPDNDQKRGR
jgi:hypothetical protein